MLGPKKSEKALEGFCRILNKEEKVSHEAGINGRTSGGAGRERIRETNNKKEKRKESRSSRFSDIFSTDTIA